MQRSSFAYIVITLARTTSIRTANDHHRRWRVQSNDLDSIADDESSITKRDDGQVNRLRIDNENYYDWSTKTLAIALPALAGMMADPILSLVDTLFVGQLSAPPSSTHSSNMMMMSRTKTAAYSSSRSSIPLAALGACTSIFHLAFQCTKGTTATTASLVAGALVREEDRKKHCNNEKNEIATQQKETTLIAQTSMKQAFITGTVIATFLLIFGPKCIDAMGIPISSSSPLFSSALTYLNHRAVAAPAVVLLTASEGIFRGFGDVITPWKVSLVVAGLTLVLDPFCMFREEISANGRKNKNMMMGGLGMGIKGAAVATSFSQVCGALLYVSLLFRKGVLGWKKFGSRIICRKSDDESVELKKRAIAATILRANAAMITKQGSLLVGWAFATAQATRMGHAILAAHQMGLSIWMLFSYALDGASVAAQVLMAREYEELRLLESSDESSPLWIEQKKKVRSLSVYMMSASIIQGLIASAAILLMYKLQPSFILTNDTEVRKNLLQLFPHLCAQMTLVSATLVAEALTIGGGRFKWLAFGTLVSSLIAMARLRLSDNLVRIWSGGIVVLFLGRLITALLAVVDMNGCIRGNQLKMSRKRTRARRSSQ